MTQLSEQELQQLTGSDLCFVHMHPKEILGFTERLELMESTPVISISADYTPTRGTEILLVDTTTASVTITLPLADRGREFNVIKLAEQNALYVAPTPTDEIIGSSSGVVVYNMHTSLHFKAVTGGYVLL